VTKPVVGQLAPEFRGRVSDGSSRSLADYGGRWLLLVFLRHFT